jgi:hypothetical protein
MANSVTIGQTVYIKKSNGESRFATVREVEHDSFIVKWLEPETNSIYKKKIYLTDEFHLISG